MTFLLRYAPYIAAVLVVFGIGAWTGNALNPWHGRYDKLQTADAIALAQGEQAARKALEDQLAQAQAASKHNADTMENLARENAQTVADRDAVIGRVHRLEQLLAAQAARSAQGHSVPEAGSGQSAAGTSGDPSADAIGNLLIAARDEARRNAARLNALIAEITPQLETSP